MMPKMRFAAATIAFPVPLEWVGNSSGEIAYRTPYITCRIGGLITNSHKICEPHTFEVKE